ncbi:MAG: FG-GAP repeat protein, partial [Rhodopirellula sp.]|nr:FG-GAP repeat protein [Rhodopirellula sp.]
MILLNWLNAFRHRIRRRKQLSDSGLDRSSRSTRNRRQARLTRHQIEQLEERLLLTSFVESGTTLIIDLGASESVDVVSNGSSYTLTSNFNWSGFDSLNVEGDGTTTLTVTSFGLSTFDTITIDDSGSATSVSFSDSSSNNYEDTFSILLDDASAGGITFSGSTVFSGSASLSASTTQTVSVSTSSLLQTLGGDILLAGSTIDVNGAVDSASNLTIEQPTPGQSLTLDIDPTNGIVNAGGPGQGTIIIGNVENTGGVTIQNGNLVTDDNLLIGSSGVLQIDSGISSDPGNISIGISIEASDVVLNGTLSGNGSLSITPSIQGTSIGLGSGTGTFSLDASELSRIADGFSSIRIGAEEEEYFEDFNDGLLTDELEVVGPGTVNFSSGQAFFNSVSPAYLRSVDADLSQFSFIAEATFSLANNSAYFGLGAAIPDVSGEPLTDPHIFIQLDDNGSVQIFDNGTSQQLMTGFPVFNQNRIRLTWDAVTQSALFEIDVDNFGFEFVPDFTFSAVDGSNNGFTDSNSRFFVGGSLSSTIDDIKVELLLGGDVDIDGALFQDNIKVFGSSIAVTGLDAGMNSVTLTAIPGAITDGGDSATDIIAGHLLLDSNTGAGQSGDELSTVVSSLSGLAEESGGIFVTNTGDLTISGPSTPDPFGINGLSTHSGPISITTDGILRVSTFIEAQDADVELTASGDVINSGQIYTDGDVIINADSNADGSGSFIQEATPVQTPTTFYTDSPYFSEADIPSGLYVGTYTYLENFENGTLDGGIMASPGGIIQSPGNSTGNVDSVDGDGPGGLDSDGTDGHSFFVPSGFVTFTPPTPATAVGLVVTGTDGAQVFAQAFAPGGAFIGQFGPIPFPPDDGSVFGDRFIGISFGGGIESISVFTDSGSLEVDHVQYGNGQIALTVPTIDAQLGNILITAADVELTAGTLTVGNSYGVPGMYEIGVPGMTEGGIVSFTPSQTDAPISLGSIPVVSGDFSLTEIELNTITASDRVIVGNPNSGDVTFTSTIAPVSVESYQLGSIGFDTLEIRTGGKVESTTSGENAFTGNALGISAADGIGTTGPLEISASHFAASTTVGGIHVSNAGPLSVTTIGNASGLTATTGDIEVSSGGSLTVYEAVTSGGGNVVLGAAGNVILEGENADVTTNGGDFTVNADSDADGFGAFIQRATTSLEPITFSPDTPYLSQADIPAGLYLGGQPTILEDFEDGMLDSRIIASPEGTIQSPGMSTGAVDSVDGDTPGSPGVGTDGKSYYIAGGGVSFFPTETSTAAGIVITGTAATNVYFTIYGEQEFYSSFGPVSFAGEDGPVTGDRFFGISSPVAISEIYIYTENGPLEVDHVQFGTAAPPQPPQIQTDGGDVSITAADIELTAAISAGAGQVSFAQSQPDAKIYLGPSPIPPGLFVPELNLSSFTGTDGFTLNGINSNDRSGRSVSNAGDVNGDGFDDFIIGAYRADPGGNSGAGQSYVVFGGTSLTAGGSLNLSDLNGSNGFTINGSAAFEYSGVSVSRAGDFNHDGIDDLLIGSQTNGTSFIIYGKDTNSVGPFSSTIELSSLNASTGLRINGASPADYAGRSLASAGDINGDGIDDVIIGAYRARTGNYNYTTGASYVVFGFDSTMSQTRGTNGILNLSDLTASEGFVINGVNAYDYSGKSVSSAGDINGDLIDDIIIGAPRATTNSYYSNGASYVVFGNTNIGASGSLNLSDLDGTNGFVVTGSNQFSYFGSSVSSAGDMNGDGFDDLIIGAPYAYSTDVRSPYRNYNQAGQSYVIFGNSAVGTGGLLSASALNGTNGFLINGVDGNDFSGTSVSNAGDVNGDGFDDVLIGAQGAGPGPYDYNRIGQVYLIFGNSAVGAGGTLNLNDLDGGLGVILNGIDDNDYAGTSVSNAGDVNGDGFDDFLVGAPGAYINSNYAAGESYIIFGSERLSRFSLTDAELDLVNSTTGIIVGNAAAGDVTFTEAISPANTDTLTIVTGGSVTDTGSLPVFIGGNLAISAANGIGGNDPLDIQAGTLAAVNSTSGDIWIVNSGSLELGTIRGLEGITNTGSNPLPLSPLTNPVNRLDVNDDGSVTMLDRILVDNAIGNVDSGGNFVDVDGDGIFTFNDAQLVQDFLNSGGASGIPTEAPAGIEISTDNNVLITAPVMTSGGSIALVADNDIAQTAVGSVSVVGAGVINYFAAHDLTVVGTIMTGNAGVIADVGNQAEISNVISGNGELRKQGNGTLLLTAANTFTGETNVFSGTLLVDGSLAAASSVFVDSGAFIGGRGSVAGPLTVNGTVAPGNSPGVLNTGDFTFGDNSTFEVELGGTMPGNGTTNHDQLNVTGMVAIGNTVALDVILFNGFVPASGNTFTIINNDSTDPITDTFNGLAEGAVFIIGSTTFQISYAGGTDNNDVVLTAVAPETTIEIVNGNLVVTNANGGTSNDNLTFTADGMNLTITDNNGGFIDLLGETLDGGTGDFTSSVTIALSTFTDGTLDINTLGGDDTINIGTLTLLKDQSLDVDGGTGRDTINVTGALAASGTGSVSLNVSRNILVDIGASIATTDGNIALSANAAGTTFGDFHGLELAGPITTVDGNISLIGKSGNGSLDSDGVRISNVTIASTGTNAGTVSITGESLAATGNGLRMDGIGTISSAYADIDIQASSLNDHGLNMGGFADLIESTGTGPNAATITINASSQATGSKVGIRMDTGHITSVDGNVVITASTNGLAGLLINNGSSITSTGTTTDAATLLIQGTSTARFGVILQSSSYIESVAGDINVIGQGGSTIGPGVRLDTARITSTGTGPNAANITISGSSVGDGVSIAGATSSVSSIDGDITIFGDSSQSNGIDLAFSAIIEATGDGNIAFNANTLQLDTGIQGSRTLAINPLTPGTSIGIGNGAAGTLNLSTAELANIQNGFNFISIGDGNNGTITVNEVTFNDPVSITGPEIFVNGQISGLDNASVTLHGAFATTHLNADIVTNGNDIFIDDSVILRTDVSLNTTSGAATGASVTVAGDVNSNGTARTLNINAGTDGLVSLNAVGNVSPLNALQIRSADVNLAGNMTANLIDLAPADPTAPINLGMGGFAISRDEISRMATPTLLIGDAATTGDITLNDPVVGTFQVSGIGNLTLQTNGSFNLEQDFQTAGTLNVNAGSASLDGSITTDGDFNVDLSGGTGTLVGNTFLTSAGTINLDNAIVIVNGYQFVVGSGGQLTIGAGTTINNADSDGTGIID